jgi:hypothetical protein
MKSPTPSATKRSGVTHNADKKEPMAHNTNVEKSFRTKQAATNLFEGSATGN